jgi:hypothetical protein
VTEPPSPAVGAPSLHQSDIARQRVFQNVMPPRDQTGLLAFGELRPVSRWCVKSAHAGPCETYSLRERSLGDDFQVQAIGLEQFLEHNRSCRPRKGADNFSHSACVQKLRKPDAAGAGIVGHNRQISGTLFDQAFDKSVRLSNRAKTTDENRRTITDTVQRGRNRPDDFVDHWITPQSVRRTVKPP